MNARQRRPFRSGRDEHQRDYRLLSSFVDGPMPDAASARRAAADGKIIACRQQPAAKR
jgi:hypothetical protein